MPPIKIVIGINTLTEVEQSVYSNHCQFWYRLGRNTDFEFIMNHPRRMSIDRMRNITAKIALDTNADYLMFVDDDVLIPLNTLQNLIACNADVAAGWTIIRGYPYKNMFFRWVDDTKLNLANLDTKDITFDERGDIPVDAVGFSCVLIKTSALRKVASPYFVTGPFNTEDIYYCVKLRQADPTAKIVVNPSVKTAHNLGSEYIEPANVDAYKIYYETVYPQDAVMRKEPPTEKEVGEQLELNLNNSVDFNEGPTLEDLINEEIFTK